MDEFLTVAEVAALLKLNQQTVRNWIDAGALPAVRAGRRVRIRREDLDAVLAAAETQPHTSRDSEADVLPALGFWDGEYEPEPIKASPTVNSDG